MLEFRKIEIKELPASSPEVPKTAAEVLPFLAGNWKVERQTVDPKVPSDKGTVTHGFVAGGRFLRGHCSINEPRPDGATIEGLDFWCFEPGQNSLRRWVARSDGFTAFISGRFHPASRTLITTLRVGADDRVQQYEFVDPDTFNFQVFQKDASGMITGGFSHKCIRVKEPVAVPRLPLDPMRPEEMKVLDRLVGEWHNDKTISVARLFGKSPFDNTVPVVGPDMTSGPAVRVKAAPILGGRFIEKFETNVATGVSDYTLSWFDTAAKKYRTWCFNHTGSVTEFTGTWDEAAKTLIWNSADGGLEGRWVFKSDDSREFRHVVKDKDGKVLNEATGKSRRIAANPLPATHKNSLGMEFVIVPKGKSWLGGGKDKLGDKEVEIPADFYLGKYEVTQEEWEKVMGENPSHFSRAGGGIDVVKDVPNADLRRFPVEYVSWNQCLIFVEKLNQLEKETGWVYRLPTEVEWEHACRGGGGRPAREYEFDYYLDQPTNTVLHNQANFNFGENALNRTCKVGSYQPNRLGLYDMHGNVWEWCHDQVMDQGVSKRSTLGGGWELDSLSGRAWFRRTPHPPSHRHQTMGLRLARVRASAASPDAKTPAIAPFTDADVKRIAALPAAEQIEEIRKELMKRNPGFGGNLRSGFGPEPIIADGIVTHLAFETDNVSDISPVRALTGLRELHCNGSKPGLGRLTDLSPLKGMPLASLSVTCNANLTDLSALQGLPLKGLHVGDTGVTSIKVLEDMPLAHLWLHGTPVADLSPLAGKSLATLHCSGTRVENLKGLSAAGVQTLTCDLGQLPDEADLKRLGVKELRLERVPAIIDLERLRKLGQRLTRINNKPAEEFWKEVEKK
jgi:formylglycine-generating enzyme required for sulfatase activity